LSSLNWLNRKTGFLAILLLLLALSGKFYLFRSKPELLGVYTKVASHINNRSQDSCDRIAAERRVALARVVDKFQNHIQGVWKDRKSQDFPDWKVESVGPIFVRISKDKMHTQKFDSGVWSWEGAAGIYWDTQNKDEKEEVAQKWRDLDTSVRFLLEKDAQRVIRGREYLEPEKTKHNFLPNPKSVRRVGKKKLEVDLHAGDFEAAKEKVASIFEKEWSSKGYLLKIKWVPKGEGIYSLRANFRSGRSLVNHKAKVMFLANFAWTRTLAHELGHILGFDDHYYSIWNPKNCYYTQMSRLTDIMSNSEFGKVDSQHWQILEKAYPWRQASLKESFSYFYR